MKMKSIWITGLCAVILAGCQTVVRNDFVSGYDFQNARLEDLPWQMRAAIIEPMVVFDYDTYVRKHFPHWNVVQHHLGSDLFDRESFIPQGEHDYTVNDPSSIVVAFDRIEVIDESIPEALYCTNGVVYVSRDWRDTVNQGFDVLGYSDYNRDGFMDVLIRRQMPGSARPTEALVLTRRQTEGPFIFVESVETGIGMGVGEYYLIPSEKSRVKIPRG